MSVALRLAWFTPLPPVQSGIAQYSAELVPLVAQACDIDVYVDHYAPSVVLPPPVRVLPARQYEREHERRPYALTIYQMGNSPAHAYMWPNVERHPGLLVLHDYVLHHLHVWRAVQQGRARAYRAEMEARYGTAGREVALRTLRGQMPAAIFDYPLCEGVVEASRHVAVHSQFAADLLAARTNRHNVTVMPMGVPLYRLPDSRDARARLGLPQDAPVVASLGHISPHKRMDVALRAFARLHDRHADACFLVAGSESPGQSVRRQARMLGLIDAVRFLGYVEEASVPDVLAAADVVINLRYPTAGETSASLLRILAAGKAVIVTRAGSMAEVPAGACAHVAPDEAEEEIVTEMLLRLVQDETLRQQMGGNARQFIMSEHTLPRAAEAYCRLVGDIIGQPITLPPLAPVVIDAAQIRPQALAAPIALASAEPEPHVVADRLAEALASLALGDIPVVVASAARAMTELRLAPGQEV